MIKIAIIGIIVMLMTVITGKMKMEYGILTALAGCVLIFMFGIEKLKILVDLCKEIEGYIGIDSLYIGILMKMVGIAYISEFAASLCKDAGQGAVAGQIDFAGKVTMIAFSTPILKGLLDTMFTIFPGGGSP